MTDATAPVGAATKGATKGVAGVFKRVPKWAWVASGGVVIGVLYMRRTQKGTPVDTSASEDATAPGDYGQTTAQYGTFPGSVGAGAAASGDYAGGGLGSQPDLPSIISALTPLIPPPVDIPSIIDSIAGAGATLYPGGGAPQSSATASPPAPATAAPTPAAPPVKTPNVTGIPKAPDKCTGTYPNLNEANGKCYRVVLKGSGSKQERWHYYAPNDSPKVKV